ncbi:MAG TPA: glycosyltransferase family 39 protein [Longimicrobium sp.]|jgi:hypothetical protein
MRLAPLALVALAAALRLPGLARFPFEQDELYTIQESRLLWDVPLLPGIDARPLYFLLQHALSWLAPETPVALRAMPLVFGLLGVWLVWRAGARLIGPAAGLAAGLLVAVAPWHLHASGMARYWSLLFLLAAAFYLALARGCETDRPRHLLAALAVLVAGMLTHPTFLFPAAGAALGVTLVDARGRPGWRWPSRRAWALLWGPFLAALAAFALLLELTGREEAVRNWGGRGWAASARLVPAMVEWLTPAVAVAALAGALLLLAEREPARRRWGAMTLVGGLSSIVLLLAASTRTDVYADYAIAALPLGFVSAGALVQLAAERAGPRARAVALSLAAVLAAAVLPGTASHLSDGMRFDYRPAFRHIERTAPRVAVATWPVVVQQHYAPSLRGLWLLTDPRRLDGYLAAERDLWVVTSVRRYGIVGDGGGRAAAWLDGHCRREMAYERPRWDYRVYRVEVWRCRG